MSILIQWPLTKTVGNKVDYPELDRNKIRGATPKVDKMAPANSIVIAEYDGPASDLDGTIATIYTPPTRPEITITDITTSGAPSDIDWQPENNLLRTRAGVEFTVTASNTGPDGDWDMPILNPSGDIEFVQVSSAGNVMTIIASMPRSGLWEITNKLINEDIPKDYHFIFSGLKIRVAL